MKLLVILAVALSAVGLGLVYHWKRGRAEVSNVHSEIGTREQGGARTKAATATKKQQLNTDVIEPRNKSIHSKGLLHGLVFGDMVDIAALYREFKANPIGRNGELHYMLACATEAETPRILIAIAALARFDLINETWAELVSLADAGPTRLRLEALKAIAYIGDAKAKEVFLHLLTSTSNYKEGGVILQATISLAQYVHSPEIGEALSVHAASGSQAAVMSLTHVGFGANVGVLTQITSSSPRKEVAALAKCTLETASILTSPDRDTLLLQAVRRPPAPDEWFSWPEWALTKLEECHSTGAVDELFRIYDSFQVCPFPILNNDYYRDYWSGIKVRVLRTISRLGGQLSSEQAGLLSATPLRD